MREEPGSPYFLQAFASYWLPAFRQRSPRFGSQRAASHDRCSAYGQKRLNQAIELLAEGQPVYYTGSHSGTNGTYEQGLKDSQTYADYISYDMEDAPYDIKGLQDYMRGLVAGGPDRSGHRIPTVIVNVPVNGLDYAAVHANAWMFSRCSLRVSWESS